MSLERCRQLIVILASLAGVPALAGSLNETRSTLEQWVEARQLISKTRNDWQADRELIEQTIALYERELKSLDEQFAKIATNNTQVARELTEAEAARQTALAARERAAQFAAEFEPKLRPVAARMPAPLQEMVKKELARLPADPANTKLLPAERLQTCVAVLNEFDKFNSAVNLFNEKRANERGEEVAVQTLYAGLGAAWFVNDTGDFAGVGAPGSNGWTWTTQPALAGRVQLAVKIYRNEHPAAFLTLPVSVK